MNIYRRERGNIPFHMSDGYRRSCAPGQAKPGLVIHFQRDFSLFCVVFLFYSSSLSWLVVWCCVCISLFFRCLIRSSCTWYLYIHTHRRNDTRLLYWCTNGLVESTLRLFYAFGLSSSYWYDAAATAAIHQPAMAKSQPSQLAMRDDILYNIRPCLSCPVGSFFSPWWKMISEYSGSKKVRSPSVVSSLLDELWVCFVGFKRERETSDRHGSLKGQTKGQTKAAAMFYTRQEHKASRNSKTIFLSLLFLLYDKLELRNNSGSRLMADCV